VKPALNDLLLGPQFLLWQMKNKISLSDFVHCCVFMAPQFLLGQTQKEKSSSKLREVP